jgi:3-oxoacid CoA-transferase A subunit
VPQGTIAERLRAAGAGIPAFYTPTAVGTELAEGKETRIFDGREYLLEHALPVDYAFIRAHRADAFGNLQFRRSQRNFNPVMAMAARTVIVEIEQDILPVGAIDPDHVHTSGVFVHRMVRIKPPPDAWWPVAGKAVES